MFTLEEVLVEDVLYIKELCLEKSIISIEGQSGTGKSTILRLLNNLDDPTSGSIFFKEEEIISIPPQKLRRKVVMLPQSPVIFDGTIRDNLQIGLQFSGDENAPDEKLKEMLQFMLLKKDLKTKASELSGGEKQRLALARLLLLESADVYLLDEPSSDLDNKTTEQVMGKFFEIAKRNKKQTIFVTHDQEVSKQFADEVINMDTYSKRIQEEDEES